MTNYYVSKTGSDANDGLSLVNAKKTLAAAGSVSSAADTIYVYPGVYQESMLPIRRHWTGVGRVVIDAALDDYIFDNAGDASTGSQGSVTDIGCRGAFLAVFGPGRAAASSTRCIFYSRCHFRYAPADVTMTECVFLDWALGRTGASFLRCLFMNSQLENIFGKVVGCVFLGTPLDGRWYNLEPYGLRIIDSNVYSVVDATHTLNDETTLAAAQANGYDEHSVIVTDPVDLTTLHPLIGSILPVAGEYNGQCGPYRSAHVISPTTNSAIWDAPHSSTGLSQDVNGGWVIDAPGSASLVTQVIDLGTPKMLRRVRPIVDMDDTGGVIDTTTGDNRLTIRFRHSTTSFAAGDASPAWQEIDLDQDLSVVCQYYQMDIKIRTDGDY